MTFKREMEKAVKGYLKPLGFKYVAKHFVHIRRCNDDISHSLGYADETHFRPHYYFLKTFVGVASRHLNEILWEASDGFADAREIVVGPVYFCSYRDAVSDEDWVKQGHYIHCEFMGDRPMEENVADFDRMYREDVQMLYDKYSTQKAIFLCPITDRFFNRIHTPFLWYYVPLAYYFNGEFDKAFAYIEERLEIEKNNLEVIRSKGCSITEETLSGQNTFTAMRKNLKKWIEEKRTFQVDDEYLPKF